MKRAQNVFLLATFSIFLPWFSKLLKEQTAFRVIYRRLVDLTVYTIDTNLVSDWPRKWKANIKLSKVSHVTIKVSHVHCTLLVAKIVNPKERLKLLFTALILRLKIQTRFSTPRLPGNSEDSKEKSNSFILFTVLLLSSFLQAFCFAPLKILDENTSCTKSLLLFGWKILLPEKITVAPFINSKWKPRIEI